MEGLKLVVARMREHPVGWRQQMRALSLGPTDDGWGMWGWSFHDGSTWAAVALSGGRLVGWAALTCQVDYLPVVGVYVAPERRGEGLARRLVQTVLGSCVGDVLAPGQEVFAAVHRWPLYEQVIDSCGLRCRAWE